MLIKAESILIKISGLHFEIINTFPNISPLNTTLENISMRPEENAREDLDLNFALQLFCSSQKLDVIFTCSRKYTPLFCLLHFIYFLFHLFA